MIAKLNTLLGMSATGGLVAFWVPEIWNYGYMQIGLGQLSAFALGLFVAGFIARSR